MFRSPMTLSTAQRVTTLIVCVIVTLPLVVTLVLGLVVAVPVLPVVLVLLGFCWAMSPREVVVEAGELRIERRAWAPVRVPLGSIETASAVEGLGPGTRRVLGVGGFFGSYGVFQSGKLGRFRLYATHAGRALLLTRRGKDLPIVITPDDVAGAIASIGRPARSTPT